MGGLFGKSSQDNTAIAEAKSTITQQYNSTCNVSCSNEASGIVIDIRDTNVTGGITFTQECSVDATCLSDASLDAVITTELSVDQLAAASDILLNRASDLNNYARLSISQQLSQSVNQECNLSSSNQLSDVTILAQNSNISGGIAINQSATTSGGCVLDSSLTAATYAQGLISQTSQSGKAAKKGAGLDKGTFWTWFGIAAGIILLTFCTIALIKVVSKKKQNSPPVPPQTVPIPPNVPPTLPVQAPVYVSPTPTVTNVY